MAIARPAHFTAISGKMGCVEFAQRGLTTTIRNAKKPKTKVTWRTIEAQRIHACKIYLWKWLHANEPQTIILWNDYATRHPITNRLGNAKTITSLHWFLALYIQTIDLKNATAYPPYYYPQTPAPVTFTATFVAPSSLTITADFVPESRYKVVRSFYYSPPILTSATDPKLRRLHLANNNHPYGQSPTTDFTTLLTRREITFTPGQQTLITVIGVQDYHPRSVPYTLLVTVTAP